jgi:hypothetical protein
MMIKTGRIQLVHCMLLLIKCHSAGTVHLSGKFNVFNNIALYRCQFNTDTLVIVLAMLLEHFRM